MSITQRRQTWAQRIADCEASGQTIIAWCQANEIKLCNYHYWKRRLREQGESTPGPLQWLSLDIQPLEERPSLPTGSLVVEVGQVRIIVATGFDQRVFRDVVNILQTL